jgi:hypothetical protein
MGSGLKPFCFRVLFAGKRSAGGWNKTQNIHEIYCQLKWNGHPSGKSEIAEPNNIKVPSYQSP